MVSPDPPPAVVAALRSAGCVFAEDEAALLAAAAASEDELDEMVARRASGVPLEHVLGWAEFCGLRIAVDPGVFVPRQRTALLVAQAVHRIQALAPTGSEQVGDGRGAVVVDLCCGSGAIGAAIAATVPDVEVHAADVDPAAVACARRNLPRVHQGDLYAALPDHLRGRVDLLVVNAPYVPTAAIATMPPEARDHEPRVALDGGPDGLDVQRRVAADAPVWLRPGGALLIETGADQAPHTAELFGDAGLVPRVVYAEDATVVIGER